MRCQQPDIVADQADRAIEGQRVDDEHVDLARVQVWPVTGQIFLKPNAAATSLSSWLDQQLLEQPPGTTPRSRRPDATERQVLDTVLDLLRSIVNSWHHSVGALPDGGQLGRLKVAKSRQCGHRAVFLGKPPEQVDHRRQLARDQLQGLGDDQVGVVRRNSLSRQGG